MIKSEHPVCEAVCLVDDDPSVLRSLRRLLMSVGLSVRGFSDAESFLAFARTEEVRLAVVDIWMTGMSGLELQARLSSLSPQTRVIVMTGREDAAAKLTATRAGAVAFFSKPFDDGQFLAAVQAGLEIRA